MKSDTQGTCSCVEVAELDAYTYEVNGHATRIHELTNDSGGCDGRLVIIDGMGRIDFIPDDETSLENSIPMVEQTVKDGWELWAVVPLRRSIEAHTAFRHKIPAIQSWWQDEKGTVAFSEPEIP